MCCLIAGYDLRNGPVHLNSQGAGGTLCGGLSLIPVARHSHRSAIGLFFYSLTAGFHQQTAPEHGLTRTNRGAQQAMSKSVDIKKESKKKPAKTMKEKKAEKKVKKEAKGA